MIGTTRFACRLVSRGGSLAMIVNPTYDALDRRKKRGRKKVDQVPSYLD